MTAAIDAIGRSAKQEHHAQMRSAFFTAALLPLWATPAHATQGLVCWAESGARPRISLVLGPGGIAGASLDEHARWLTVGPQAGLRLTQAWIDRDQAMADIVGPAWNRIARLRVRFDPPARGRPTTARGTLTLRGRTFRVRCSED